MELSDSKLRDFGRRLITTRMRMLSEHGFYGLLLANMKFAVGDELDTAWVTNDTITFNPEFMDSLSDDELIFILEHEVLHAALGHLSRGRNYEDRELFNWACDIVVNSNILLSNGMDSGSITLKRFGESIHVTPRGDEGYNYTAEEVYGMYLEGRAGLPGGSAGKLSGGTSREAGKLGGSRPRDGAVGKSGGGGPERLKERSETRDAGRVVELDGACEKGQWDWHVLSDEGNRADDRAVWLQRIRDAREAVLSRDSARERGLVPRCVERLLGELGSSKMDWRTLLNDFVQEEVYDYSFSIPDRRFSEGPFILPSYSDTDAVAHDVLFMIDASASVSDKDLTAAFSEIKAAFEQFGGKLDGWVGFFDATSYEPVRFETIDELMSIRPEGGGGTRFEAVFECVERHLAGEPIACIVILSDGRASFPEEAAAKGIPVLWLLTSASIVPPWGRIARL